VLLSELGFHPLLAGALHVAFAVREGAVSMDLMIRVDLQWGYLPVSSVSVTGAGKQRRRVSSI
jgi:hypothetical protein